MLKNYLPENWKKDGFVLAFCLLFFLFNNAQNAIVIENALTGTPQSQWDVNGAGDLSILGFATDISVNKGETVHFKINTDASNYTIEIYRLGYYQGNGARRVGSGVITAALPQTQPNGLYDATSGLLDCGNWLESAHWDVPANAVSGIYIAKLTRTDNGGASHMVFIVRDDASTADIYFQASDATWQAYNVYGGNSLYVGSTSYPSGHATKVSYNRPFITRNGGGGGGEAQDWLFNAEYPMIRWLERNGYNISYTSDMDADRHGNLILNHKAFLSVGHDEYWSGQQRSNVEAALSAGVHLGFFSGNEIYWKTRWETSIDGSNTPYRTLVCYKEGTLGENVCGGKCDPLPNVWTGLWRDGCAYPSADGCRPENALSGQISWDGTTGAIEVPDTYKNLRFWRNTSIASLGAGQTATLTDGTLGYEWDWEQYTSNYRAGRFPLSNTLQNTHTHRLSLYRNSNGAWVFGAGTVQWSWGLDSNHDNGNAPEDVRMQQATVNLFADMGIQPTTLQSNLITASASTDVQAPTSTITTPPNGALLPNGSRVTISGTANDNNVVAAVEVSTDGGLTWLPATGTTSWTFSWIPTTQGVVTIKSRAIDDSGNMEPEGTAPAANAIIDTIGAPLPVVCPCTIFQASDVPATPVENDHQPLELGVKFRASEDGYITGLRYYKGAGATGVHIGHLWSGAGTLLAEVYYTNETASGWQQATLGNPVQVTAGNTYVASYFSPSGDYAYTDQYFTQDVINGPLVGLADGEEGLNGVYVYNGEGATFPTNGYQASNYWADVVFNTSIGPDTTAPTVISTAPVNSGSNVSITNEISATFSEAIDASTISASSFLLYDSTNTLVNSAVSYNAALNKAILTPSASLSYSETYHAVVKGGSGYQRIKDVAGNAMLSDYSWTFTTAGPPPPPPVEGAGGPILIISAASNPFSRYMVEILRAEGLNEFKAMDISQVNASVLNNYDVVILGDIPLAAADVTNLTNWVNAGGTLIASKPDPQLASLLGITSTGSTLVDKYLLVDTSSAPGHGIVPQTVQFHSSADLYTLSGATALATLYSNASTATTYPAVTMRSVGANGGIAAAFTFDLARSVVYTRQGNPAWINQKRDGQIDPIRSDDMFYPDWIDFNKIAIPQADEQQHLLSNIILKGNLHRKPLPKFWFLPKGLKAAIVMTGDDHGDAGMQPRFDINIQESTAGCSVDDWDCIRSTGYLYVGSTFNDSMAKHYNDLGFEVALHVLTNCQNFTQSQYQNFITSQESVFNSTFPSIPSPSTNRNHCIAWSDWSMTAEVEAANGIRLDANYYYWPGAWIQNRAGMFTGSGMPMRFAKLDGSLIDCYQAVTQMPDESDEVFPDFCNALLDKATGAEGYYGVFTTNMHFDQANHAGANAIVASAKAHGVPVVTALQMLKWLDGRNNSNFDSIKWVNNELMFSVSAATGSRNIQGMLPVNSAGGVLSFIAFNGIHINYNTQTIKGIQYAFFPAGSGNYVANYNIDNTAPVITNIVAVPHNDGTATITWTTNEAANSKVDYAASPNGLNLNVSNANYVTSHTVTLNGLSAGVTYNFRVSSADASNNVATSPVAPDSLNFTMPSSPCANDQTTADFNAGTVDLNTIINPAGDGAVTLKPAFDEEFSGSSVPSGWTDAIWDGQGGAITTYSGGQVTVDGTHLTSNSTFGPGTTLEFSATFTNGNFQNVGFANDASFNTPWVTIGRGNEGDNNVYARSSDGQKVALGTLVGSAHNYKIQWSASTFGFTFYVDGNVVSTPGITTTVSSNLVLQISSYPVSSATLSVDWVRVSPYATSGSFTSRVFGGNATATWGVASWTADVPANTSLSIYTRTGNTATPDNSWSSFAPVASSGTNIGSTERYIQYRVDLTGDGTVTPALKDIAIACSSSTTDNTPPVISNVAANPAPVGTSATITWLTNENADSRVDYSTDSTTLGLNGANSQLVINHTVNLAGLTPGTVYYYRVTSKDSSANSAASPIFNFTTPVPTAPCFTDITYADFSAGSTEGSTYISLMQDGEVTLKPATASEFVTLPAITDWNSFPWSGGTSTVSAGVLTVSGARYNSEPASTVYGPGSTLEFVATFGAAAYQHIGFGGGTDVIGTGGIYNGESPWAMFSTKNTTNTLYARTYINSSTLSDFAITGISGLIGSSHKFRINWKTDGTFVYYVDDSLVHTETLAINSSMRPAISDYNDDATPIKVDWIRLKPYVTPGSFVSRVYDAGSFMNWGNVLWNADVPAGTALAIAVREGNTAIPDSTWTGYSSITISGNSVGGTSRYIQYKASLSSTDSNQTAALRDISIYCSPGSDVAPTVNIQPASQIVCGGGNAMFISAANGTPAPSVQWQVSLNAGGSWNNISGATNDSLVFLSSTADNGKQYRAVWTNAAGTVTSNAATLTVNAIVTASISAVSTNICTGDSLRLQLSAASGQAPYNITVNGNNYTGINVGQTFAVIPTSDINIWSASATPANPSVTDNQAIETGVKFRTAVDGYIKGIRFYKGTTNTGTHVASLWSSTGTQLATATFTSETASGWQEVQFASPILVQANTTYIASYYSASGYFAIDANYFTANGVSNGPLTALKSGVDGPNGVYKYGGGFPNSGNTANYWVDVVFAQLLPDSSSTYALTNVTDNSGCSNNGNPLSSVTVKINKAAAGGITAPVAVCANDSINLAFNATAGTDPYSLTINGNVYNNIQSGVPFFAAKADSALPTSIWSSNTIGGEPTVVDNSNLELGIKFRSTSAGQVTGIRFYKRTANTGTHTGSLWSSTGTLLATATFTNETTSGWQQVSFSNPVTISPNVTYVASYHAPNGNYAYNSQYFTNSGVTNGPITALQSGVDGQNGVYNYGSGTVFPNQSYNNANYWVDVVFVPIASKSFSLTDITSSSGCSVHASPINSVTVNINQVSVLAIAQTNVACFGQSTGSVTVAASGGTSPYSFKLGSVVNTNGVFAGLGAGTYNISATDATGCLAVIPVTILQPASTLYISENQVNVLCHGSNTGSIDLTVTGGTMPYKYLWNTAANTEDISNLAMAQYSVSVTDSNACSITGSYSITEPAAVITNQSFNICSGGSVTVGSSTYNTTGDYTDVFTSINGCDSTVYTHVVVITNYAKYDTASICSGNSYNYYGQIITVGGDYSHNQQSQQGCDSTNYLHLIVNAAQNVSFSASICSGSSYMFNGIARTTTGSYQATLTAANGCDSIVTLNLTVLPTYNSQFNATICNGGSYIFNSIARTTTGSYSATLTAANGCDSVVTLNLTVLPSYNSQFNATICNGSSYMFNGIARTTTGSYTATLTAANGCDSVVTLNLTVLPALSSSFNASICSGSSYMFNGIARTTTGSYTATLISSTGCDSVVTLNLTVLPAFSSSFNANICSGSSYMFNGIARTTTGTYTATFTTAGGCDSVVTLNLTVLPKFNSSFNASICSGGSYMFNGIARTTTGSYTATFTAATGCDSVVTLNLTVLAAYSSSFSVNICNGDSYVFNGVARTTTGLYYDTLTAANGCDSIVALNLTVNPATPPILSCPTAPAPTAATNGLCSALVSTGNPVFSDNCGTVTKVLWALSGATTGSSNATGINYLGAYRFNIGTTAVTYTAYNNASQFTSCSFNVVVTDNQAPVISCPANISVTANQTNCNKPLTIVTPVVTDNCGVSSIINSYTGTANASSTYPVGTTNVIWTATDVHGLQSRCTQVITIYNCIGIIGNIQNTLCSGTTLGSITTSVSGGSPAYTYRWNTGATTANLSNLGAGTYTLTVTDLTSGSATAAFVVRAVTPANPPAVPGAISGVTQVCPGSTNSYSISAVPTATSYIWKVPIHATIISGQGTTQVTVKFQNNFSSGNIAVYASNCRGTSNQSTLAVSLQALPARPASVIGNTAVCPSSQEVYTVSTVTGATSYTWTVPQRVTIISGQGTNQIKVQFSSNFYGGTISANAVNCTGSGSAKSLFVGLQPTPAQPSAVSGNSFVCSGNIYSYQIASVVNATSYNWSVTSGSILSGQGTTSVRIKFYGNNTISTIKVYAVGCSGNSSSRYKTINVSNCHNSKDENAAEDSVSIDNGPVSQFEAQIYPNPFKDQFRLKVQSTSAQNIDVRVFDLVGRPVIEVLDRDVNDELVLEGPGLIPGIYLVEVNQGENRRILRVIKSE